MCNHLARQPAFRPMHATQHGTAWLAYRYLPALAVALTVSLPAAADTADPFATGDLVAKSQAGSSNRPAAFPCDFSRADKAPLTLPDVVERALCNNPQTREAWANARAQAAQVGVGESAFAPPDHSRGSVTQLGNRSRRLVCTIEMPGKHPGPVAAAGLGFGDQVSGGKRFRRIRRRRKANG